MPFNYNLYNKYKILLDADLRTSRMTKTKAQSLKRKSIIEEDYEASKALTEVINELNK